MKEEPKVCILTKGVKLPVSPKSYANLPFVNEGQDFGSHAITLMSFFSLNFFPRKGKTKPEKLLPPPVHPTTISG